MMDRDTITRTGAKAPGVGRSNRSHGGVVLSKNLDTERGVFEATDDTNDGRKPSDAIEAPRGQAPSDKPALEPYWGKPAVRNLREDDGNVGIIRSPVAPSSYPTTGQGGFCPLSRDPLQASGLGLCRHLMLVSRDSLSPTSYPQGERAKRPQEGPYCPM